MPDKREFCAKGCERCWRNRLLHGSKQAKAYAIRVMKEKKQSKAEFEVTGPERYEKFNKRCEKKAMSHASRCDTRTST